MAGRSGAPGGATPAPDPTLIPPMPEAGELILTLSCPDRRGIVARVAGFVADRGGNILDSHQFGDPDAGIFFMRIHFATSGPVDVEEWRAAFAPVAAVYSPDAPRRVSGLTGPVVLRSSR